MSNPEWTRQQEVLITHGFYGHWWPFSPYNTKEYQKRLQELVDSRPDVFYTKAKKE